MSKLSLTPMAVDKLEVFANPGEVRHDVHVFVEYVRSREVKRSHRSNQLSKSDALRLAQLMTDPKAPAEVKENGASGWVDFVDDLARQLGFVNYDTKGVYVGYNSEHASFPDNVMRFNEEAYAHFLDTPPLQQERRLLEVLLKGANEFYQTSVVGRLDGFSMRGSATNVVPSLDFNAIRRFLLDQLQNCPSGVWLSTAAFIAHLKTAHPYFLIPQQLPKSKWGKELKRYECFYEGKNPWENDASITEQMSDAFERVEGRYVERFLEGLPLILRYIDVAYGPPAKPKLYPALHQLRAFRVSERFGRIRAGDLAAPKVTVLPNFEIYLESELYPAQVLARLTPLAEVTSNQPDTITILKLQKAKVAAQLVRDPTLNVPALLKKLTGRDLPKNVAVELEEWAGHSEKFVLYEGFSLLEGDSAVAEPFTVESLSPALRLVRQPDKLFACLEKAELAPLRFKHPQFELLPMPEQAQTGFPAQPAEAAPKPEEKRVVTLMRRTTIALHFSFEPELLEKVRQTLLAARCSFEVDQTYHTLTFSQASERQVTESLQALGEAYEIQIQDFKDSE